MLHHRFNDNSDEHQFIKQLDWWTKLRLKVRRRAKTWSSGIAALLILVVVVLTARLALKPQYHTVSGRVECSSGRSVQGIYINDGTRLGSDFASWQPEPGRPSAATYSRNRVISDTYKVGVGCGGTRLDWEVQPKSDFVSGTINNFICYDGPDMANSGKCVHKP